MPASTDISTVKRDPAWLLSISLASTMRPEATNAELERAAGIASRHFRNVRASLAFTDGENDYYAPIAAIAQTLNGDAIEEAEQQLDALHEYLGRVKDPRVSELTGVGAVACSRWTAEVDAGVLLGRVARHASGIDWECR